MSNSFNFKTVMVHSYKGGTGKTAIAVNLASYLSRVKGKKVLVIEQDMAGPTFDSIFDLELDACWNDFLEGAPLKSLIKKTELFDVILAREGEIDSGSFSLAEFFRNRVQQLHNEIQELAATRGYDHIIFDTRPGKTKDIFLSLPVASTVIFITRLDSDNIAKTISLFNDLYAPHASKRFIIVENQVPEKSGTDNQSTSSNGKFATRLASWNEFCQDRDTVRIPLDNSIAYGLFMNKIIPPDNPLVNYIAKIHAFL